MSKQLKYYSLDAILAKDAHYNLIIGERSNGKTTAVLRYALEQYIKNGSTTAYIRRYEEDIKGGRGDSIFSGIVSLGYVEELTGGRWIDIKYRARAWYLAVKDFEDEEKWILDDRPFCYAFALTKQETYKSNSYPDVRTVVFEEFLTRSYYLVDEFIIFMNLLSTIIRQRNDVKIFMLGNTVNKYAPYFQEMGLSHIKDMKKGSIDVYSYGDTNLKVAVEFADFPSKTKPSDVYFAFNNPRLNMITGQGQVWEIAIYPHIPCKYAPKNIVFTYFIIFDGEILQCEVINVNGLVFTFIHRKTGEIKEPDKDLVFSPDTDARKNWRRKITNPPDKLGQKLLWFYKYEKVFYQNNEVGEIVRNYLQFCKT